MGLSRHDEAENKPKVVFVIAMSVLFSTIHIGMVSAFNFTTFERVTVTKGRKRDRLVTD